ncbi:MAG: HEAT repeat domain-containing protein, partial [Myxococcota bacterium]
MDLRETTKRLTLALGRAGLELDQKEAELEGTDADRSVLRKFENQRQMWETRFQQLLQLFPSQLEYLLKILQNKGLFALRLQNRLNYKKDEYQWDIADWVRAEVASLLGNRQLYREIPGGRERVLRMLFVLFEQSRQPQDLPWNFRRKGVVTMGRLLRKTDAQRLHDRFVDVGMLQIEGCTQCAPTQQGWAKLEIERAGLSTEAGLALHGEKIHLTMLLKPLRNTKSVLCFDAKAYLHMIRASLPILDARLLRAAQRLVESPEQQWPSILDGVQVLLQQHGAQVDPAYRAFIAEAIGNCLQQDVEDEEIQQAMANALVACGAEEAIPFAWSVWCRPDFETVHLPLLEAFVRAGQSGLLTEMLSAALLKNDVEQQVVAARLLGAMPSSSTIRAALREKIQQDDAVKRVQWMSLRALAALGAQEDLVFLHALNFTQQQPELWAMWVYAQFACGDADALCQLIQIYYQTSEQPLRRAMDDVFSEVRVEEGTLIPQMFAPELEIEARREAWEDFVSYRSPLALLFSSHLLMDADAHKKLRQGAADDLSLLGRSLHRDDLEALAAVRSPAEWVASPLLHALEHDTDRLVRIRSARALGRLGLKQINQKFEQVLKDPSENALLRQVVAQAIGEIGETQWRDVLMAQYPQEKSLQVKQGLLKALLSLGTPKAFFLQALEEAKKGAKIQQVALEALSEHALTLEEQQSLLPFLDAAHKDVRAQAVETLGKLGFIDALPEITAKLDAEAEP